MGGMEKHEVSKYIYIAAMGFVGAFMRIVVDALVPVTGFPLATFVVNIVACVCLEVVYSFVGRRLHFPKKLVSAMGVGLIGSFSTMSAFALDTVQFVQQGSYLLAGVNVSVTFVGCFLAAAAGRALSYYLARRRFDRLLERLRAHDPEPTQAQEQGR